jgi:hypothetical protein
LPVSRQRLPLIEALLYPTTSQGHRDFHIDDLRAIWHWSIAKPDIKSSPLIADVFGGFAHTELSSNLELYQTQVEDTNRDFWYLPDFIRWLLQTDDLVSETS